MSHRNKIECHICHVLIYDQKDRDYIDSSNQGDHYKFTKAFEHLRVLCEGGCYQCENKMHFFCKKCLNELGINHEECDMDTHHVKRCPKVGSEKCSHKMVHIPMGIKYLAKESIEDVSDKE